MRWMIAALVVAVGTVAVAEQAQAPDPLLPVATKYVKLVLALGQHDADYVDAYYGAPALKKEAEASKLPLAEIAAQASALAADIEKTALPAFKDDAELWQLRKQYLARQTSALRARVSMLQGKRLTFDEESRSLYDAIAPKHTEAEFSVILDTLDKRLPGEGPVIARYEKFKEAFIIPKDRVDAVFQAAIRECANRTKAHIALPANESFTVEYVTGKSWSGYNWYQGNYRSLIQVNTDLPIYIDRAIDLACHEGYPGHHVYNVLLEQHLVRDRGWKEFSIYPLFSPQSLIAEGTANFGVEVAFPGATRTAFERDTLYPLAGLKPASAAAYAAVMHEVDRLSYAGNEAARRYLNGQADRDATANWLVQWAMLPADRARQRTKFFDQYRSYVINYNYGKDLVRAYIERQGGTVERPDVRWAEFGKLLASPRLPSSLR